MNEHIYDIEPQMTLQFDDLEKAVEVNVKRIEIDEHLVMFGHISYDDCKQIFEQRLFNLDEQKWFSEWESDKELDICLRLDTDIKSSYEDEDEIVTRIASFDPLFLKDSSWFVLEIVQENPLPWDDEEFVSIGIKTSHAHY